MEIKISKKNPEQFKGDSIVYFVRPGEGKKAPKCFNTQVDSLIEQAFLCGDFHGNEAEIISCYPIVSGDSHAGHMVKKILVVGLGKDELTQKSFRLSKKSIAKYISKIETSRMKIVLPSDLNFSLSEMCECLVEGLVLGAYTFLKHKTDKKDSPTQGKVRQLFLHATAGHSAIKEGAKRGMIAANAACLARDMANEPGNLWTAQHFADYSQEIAKKYGFLSKVFDKKDMERLKMGGILGVNQGTSEPPKLIVLEYRTGKKVPTLMFVGKGLTFDSGGISLKPGSGMEDMKYDMCGGAAVLAAMEAIGQLRPQNVDVVAIIPSTDNMPGPSALKPGDIVRQYNGKTVEIISTDAEGRLILADALSYGVKKYNPDAVIDLATLTGAVIVGLGHHTTGLMSNDDDLVTKIIEAGAKAGEPLWRLPLGKEYTKQIESKVADIKNVGGKGGGTITAGCFLQEFIGKCKWAHLDIAGTAWDFTEKSYVAKGPSGTGVRTILELVRGWDLK